jgi:uncharacterized membrane protein
MPLNPAYDKAANWRWPRSNYLTLPDYYPLAFATRWNWVVASPS